MDARWVFSFLILVTTQAATADDVDYLRDIKPLFAEKCAACHGALKQEAGLRLDAGSLIHKGSDSGTVVEPAKPDDSLIIERVTDPDPDSAMPPAHVGERLNAEQIETLKKWIAQGASIPDDESIPPDPGEHWAFQRPEKSVLTASQAVIRNPIDRYFRDRRQQLGIDPAGLADKYTLLRRVYFDVIGLPPDQNQIDRFLVDSTDRAIEKVIDELLDRPQFGERWGRHWMDVWRYSDWDGYKNELRGSQRHIWRWRDWIIQSLNQDKPYDQMIIEMLAADELDPTNTKMLAATGFLARNFHKSNRNIWLDATVEHTAKAFLGITINCARCHDHKYDPIAQNEYYQFRAIFEPHHVRTDRIPGQPNILLDGLPRAFDQNLSVETFLFILGNEKHPKKDLPIEPGVPEILKGKFVVDPVDLPVDAYFPALRQFEISETRKKLKDGISLAEQNLKKLKDDSLIDYAMRSVGIAKLRLASFERRLKADAAKQQKAPDKSSVQELSANAAELEKDLKRIAAELEFERKQLRLQQLQSGEGAVLKQKNAAVAKAKNELAQAKKTLDQAVANCKKTDSKYSPIGKQYPRQSSGRRLALARWIANKNNPLTARVAVNQIWMRHFGAPLVENVFDFGLRSPLPIHAKLLDWLAVELMERNWNLKHIHRLILTSKTWQQSSQANRHKTSLNLKLDPNNVYLWKMNVRRLDAEVIRDNILAVSGQLNMKMGGADIDFRQGEKSNRRSVYLRHAYEKQMKMLVLFDAANPTDCYRRSESIIPQQALALVNSHLCRNQSRILARHLTEQISTAKLPMDKTFVNRAYHQVLGRSPSPKEIRICLEFLQAQQKLFADPAALTPFSIGNPARVPPAKEPAQRARENLVHVLMNHNDFVTVR